MTSFALSVPSTQAASAARHPIQALGIMKGTKEKKKNYLPNVGRRLNMLKDVVRSLGVESHDRYRAGLRSALQPRFTCGS